MLVPGGENIAWAKLQPMLDLYEHMLSYRNLSAGMFLSWEKTMSG
jgi:hypothetical protein